MSIPNKDLMLWEYKFGKFSLKYVVAVLLRVGNKCHVKLLPYGTYMKWDLDFLDCTILDEMGGRIDELEQSINELRTEMGVEGSPSPSAPSQPKLEPKSTDDSA
jgi:hypothetical protein